jgi:hypothetical protein
MHCQQDIAVAKNDYSTMSEMYHNALEDYAYAIAEKRAIASDMIEQCNAGAIDEIKFAKATVDTVSYTSVHALVTHISSSSTVYDLCMQPLQCTACSLFIKCCSAMLGCTMVCALQLYASMHTVCTSTC